MLGIVKGLRASKWVPPVHFVWKSANPVCPAEFYENTVWARIKDCAIMAAGDVYPLGSTGGASMATLIVSNLPPHEHTGITSEDGKHNHTVSNVTVIEGNDGFISKTDRNLYNNSGVAGDAAGEHEHPVTIGITGGGESFSILNPYVTKYMWERIS